MEDVIEHSNIFYIRDFSQLGGVETFVYEMVKKYKDLDIAVVYKTADIKQIARVRQYCRLYRHTNQKIKCKVAIINYDVSIIDFIDKNADIYQVVHGDYENPAYTWKPPTHPRIKEYICITKYICESFERITGNKNIRLSYNPLSVEKEEKKLVLISLTRLSRVKGKDRMIRLAEALDSHNIKYIWYVFTDDYNVIPSENVVYMKPRLDTSYWLEQADYLVQLSDTEGCSYSINEALYRNIPVIVTPLPYLEEIGVKDGVNSYIMNFDCSNIEHIVKNIQNKPSFQFKKLEDDYKNILAKSKSYYKEEMKNMEVLEALEDFFLARFDEVTNIVRKGKDEKGKLFYGDVFECKKDLADYLTNRTPNPAGRAVAKIIKVIPEIKEVKEEPKKEVKKEVKKPTERKKRKTTKK